MAVAESAGLGPVLAFGLVGVFGVGAQWLAWRLRLPAIVIMLAAGLIAGPATGLLNPSRDFGELLSPLIALAVAVILFEGGFSLDLHRLGDAKSGVKRLVFIGAPLGWLLSTLALVWGAQLSWESAAVFGGIMVVTGPTVIAPLLRTAKLARRPARLLQWEAIVNDPIGALAAVLAFEVVITLRSNLPMGEAIGHLALGIAFAAVIGGAVGWGIARAFGRGLVPEFMKVPVLFATLLITFAVTDSVLHESGLLAVTVMGLVIGNADLPSYEELRRFKEHATVLLVSGVFILLAANIEIDQLAALDWHALLFVVLVVLVARPLTVLISLIGSGLPRNERLFIAFTGPRGVVLVAVAGLFGQRLAEVGVLDGVRIGPLAFVLVLLTVIVHGFTLAPMARRLGLANTDKPGLLIVGGSRFTTALAETLMKAEVPVLITDPNHAHLIRPRANGIKTFYGDILGEAAEDTVELMSYSTLLAATDNDAYNTLVATDLAPELGRDKVWQMPRLKDDRERHALPTQLGGRRFGAGRTLEGWEKLLAEGWIFRVTKITEEYGLPQWREKRPNAQPVMVIARNGDLRFVTDPEAMKVEAGARIISLLPPEAQEEEVAQKSRAGEKPSGQPGPAAPIP
ncbi:sodium:proton exchanger [Thioclava sp. L04-15]|jgi:sodium/proton antiporter, CPA1 family (TC 2.A.36)|uniref:cation:proton antiporter n=1 Tax=Thioclava sp. L04-15 TaxID=1915318 RepID=UPI0009984E41|nr:sodium:proton antiporter [Thioclava sp. L04-15]OOY27158.1 sodium:proton exchanger [Thioclava sp. L04-15]TNE92726.1 MAG: sodium:proton antiporter [Paracoccaceae bacterium]